jgi:glutathione S-transferase
MIEPITLYHYWSSTCSQKARFALLEKGLDWDSRHVDIFKFEHWDDDYVKLNSNGTVPTMTHGSLVITDSNIMLEYLDDAFPDPSLRPESAGQRSLMRYWMKQADNAQKFAIKIGFNLRIKPRMAHLSKAELRVIGKRNPNPEIRASWLRKIEHGVPQEQVDQGYAAFEALANRIEQQTRKTAWLAGDEFSLADIALSPYLNRIEVLEHPEILASSARPALARWWLNLQDRPAYKTAYAFENPNPDDPIKR